MNNRKKNWLIGSALVLAVLIIGVLAAAPILIRRSEPYIREQTIGYLRDNFDSEVQFAALRVEIPRISSLGLIRAGVRGVIARVEGEGIVLRYKGRQDLAPMFTIKKLSFDVDLGTLLHIPRRIRQVTLEGLEINIPPKGRPEHESDRRSSSGVAAIIQEVVGADARLTILPVESGRVPIEFDIHRFRLESVNDDLAMRYDASFASRQLPGEVSATGALGPWSSDEPGATPIHGSYTLEKADLGGFSELAGILHSAGEFAGSLASMNVRGQADAPDLHLKISGNPVAFTARFDALVDGAAGRTMLKPLVGRLGSSDFTTGEVAIEHKGDEVRTLPLDVWMPQGNLPDLLRLAMKGPPFMEGAISLTTKIDIPLRSAATQKLRLSGQFESAQARFARSNDQKKIDALSRRGQGEPNNESIDDVVSSMKGVFDVEDDVMTLRSLSFAVPGADVKVAGDYHSSGLLDFHGTLKLEARVSQTMTGWKRWILKPVDPLFAKNGAGAFLHIKIAGTVDEPKFGLDPGNNKKVPDSGDAPVRQAKRN